MCLFSVQITIRPNDVLFVINVRKYLIFLNNNLCCKKFYFTLVSESKLLQVFYENSVLFTRVKRLKTTDATSQGVDYLQLDQNRAQWGAVLAQK
jgi:hypothetical protein